MKIPRQHLTLLLTAALSAVLLLAAAQPARAQAPGSIDTAFNANVVGSEVMASAVQPDGKIIIAGSFSSILGVLRNNIARLNADGTLDMGFNPNANGMVQSVVVQADGKVLLGGAFTTLRPNGAPSATTRNRIARVNGDGTLDSFDPNANNLVLSVAVQADGKVLLGGTFTTLRPNGAGSPTARLYIARVNGDGTLDTGFNPGADNEVRTVAVQTDGKVLLGGFFTTVAGTTRHFIARVDGVGMIDTGFNPNPDSVVSTVAVQADGKVLLGGFFGALQPNGVGSPVTRNWIARVNGDGTLDTGFNPNANSQVLSLVVQADGKVLLGGNFDTLQPNGAASPTTRNRIARVYSDGTLDTGFDPNPNNQVNCVVVQADGKVLLGGIFTTLQPNGAPSATTRNYLARVNNDTSIQTLSAPNAATVLWERRGGGPALTGQVTFEQSINGGANYTSLGAGTRVGTSETWQLTGLSLPASGGLLRARGRTAGGNFNATSGIVQQVEDFGPAGSLATIFDANVSGGTGLNEETQATAVQPDGKIIIAGDFTSVLGVPRNRIARLNADGTLDTSFDPNANHWVLSVAVQPDGKVLLGGPFTTLQPNGAASPTTRNRIARVNADGTLDTSFDPNANNQVLSLAVQADGKVLLGGFFTALQPNGAASPTTRNRIARVNSDGTVDTVFDPNSNNRVRSVAVQADGKVLLGGDFSIVGGEGRNAIARVNANGSPDTGFNPNPNGVVTSVAVQANGKVLLGGTFTTFQPNGVGPVTTRNRIARVNADATLDMSFDPRANDFVWSIALQADGKVLLGGGFTTLQPNGAASPTTRNRIARVNGDGTLDTGFDPNANGVVTSVMLQADGKVLLGGIFTTLQPNSAPSPTTRKFFARLNNDAATQSLTAPSITQVLWSRGGAAPEISQVTFEHSTNGGGTWAALGNGLRVGTSANWQLTGLSLPTNGHLRARGRTTNAPTDGAGLIEQVAAYNLPPPPTPTQVVSRKLHGGTPFDITLPLTGNLGIECRSGGAANDYQVIFTFPSAVTFTSAMVTSGVGSVSGSSGSGTTTISINLTGVTNAQRLTVTLLGASNGTNTGDLSAQMGMLLGDVNGNAAVNSTDISQTKLQSGQPATNANFRQDVIVSGSINATDVSSVKLKSGTSLPP